jgi:hypothetical protein
MAAKIGRAAAAIIEAGALELSHSRERPRSGAANRA